jgi:hypothetical protein
VWPRRSKQRQCTSVASVAPQWLLQRSTATRAAKWYDWLGRREWRLRVTCFCILILVVFVFFSWYCTISISCLLFSSLIWENPNYGADVELSLHITIPKPDGTAPHTGPTIHAVCTDFVIHCLFYSFFSLYFLTYSSSSLTTLQSWLYRLFIVFFPIWSARLLQGMAVVV